MEILVKIAEREGEPVTEIPLEEDNSLLISTLQKYFPDAEGLKYYSDSDAVYNVITDNERLYAPHNGWNDTIYYCTSVKDESICIEDVPVPADEEEKEEISIVHISIKQTPKTVKKKRVKPKGKNKKRKPYKCDICEKNFRNKDYMEKHKLVHTGEKPFMCTICEERFHRPDMVRLHVHKVHSIRREPKLKLPPRSPVTKREKRRNDDTYEWGIVKKRKYTRRKLRNDQMKLDDNDFDIDDNDPEAKSFELSCNAIFDENNFPNNAQTQFTCEECSETFNKLSKLRLHLFKYHGQDQRNIRTRKLLKPRNQKYSTSPKSKTISKYAVNDLAQLQSEDSSGEEFNYWDCLNENDTNISYVSKCHCVPNFSMVKYIENKIPAEVLTKFRLCKQNNVPWTGFLGYSALYKFWIKIITDNPSESKETDIIKVEKEDISKDVDYLVVEEEEPSEATTENSNFLKSLDDLIKFN